MAAFPNLFFTDVLPRRSMDEIDGVTGLRQQLTVILFITMGLPNYPNTDSIMLLTSVKHTRYGHGKRQPAKKKCSSVENHNANIFA